MSQFQLSDNEWSVWSRLVETHSAFLSDRRTSSPRGSIVPGWCGRHSATGKGIVTACHVLKSMKVSEVQSLFDVLVEWVSTGHGLVHVFREAIVNLPREWVLARIEEAAEPYLLEGTYDEFRRFLELYSELDKGLTEKLGGYLHHPDADVQEAGEDFLERLNVRKDASRR